MANADRLIELFNEAKARPAGPERDRFLDEACSSDPELKQQVLALLQANDHAGSFLKHTLVVSPTALVTEKPGDKIGRYKLLQVIGEGGCGVVYMAEQDEPVRRKVALKVIKLGMDTKSVIARFEAERQALALMDHPNIAKVFDAGATDLGRPYFVMELVRGIAITDYCDQNNLTTPERLDLFIEVCQAIQHAHQKGIIHRDIKPSNILVSQHDTVAVPKVIDFGIAKATSDQRLTDKTLFTAFEQFMGTPAYMSSEQAQWSGLDIDTRTDIYSLGVLLYELLTGQTPFNPEHLLRSGLDEMRRIIREEEPPRPSTRLATLGLAEATELSRTRRMKIPELVHRLRGDLDWIVMKCLEKDRTRRYETANGLAADLQRHLGNEPVLACPPSTAYRLHKAFRRNRLAFSAAAIVAVVFVLGFAGVFWQWRSANRARLDAIHEAAAKSRAEFETRQQRDRAATLLSLAQVERGVRMLEENDSKGLLYLLEARRAVEHLPEDRRARTHLWEEWYDGVTQAVTRVFRAETNANERPVPFSPDGHRWLVCVTNGTWQLCDLTTGDARSLEKLGPFIAQSDQRVVSADGRWLAASGNRGVPGADGRPTESGYRLELFELAGNELRRHQLRPPDPTLRFEQAWGLYFTPDGRWLFERTGQELQRYDVRNAQPAGQPFNVGFGYASPPSPDGRWLLFSSNANALVLDIERNEIVPHGLGDGHARRDLVSAFSPDSSLLALGASDGRIGIWNMIARRTHGRPFTSPARFKTLSFIREGRELAAVSADGMVRIHRVATDEPGRNPLREWDRENVLGFSPDGSVLVDDPADRVLRWINPATGQATMSADVGPDPIWQAAFSADGQLMATAAGSRSAEDRRERGLLRLWRTATGMATGQSWPLTNRVRIAFSPDGKTLAAVLADSGSVELLDIASGQPGERLRLPPGQNRRNAEGQFSPDSQRFNTREQTLPMNFWEISTRQWLRRDSSARFVAVSPDWKVAVTSEEPMGLIEYPLPAAGQPVRKGLGDVFTSRAMLIAFTRDSGLLAAAHEDNSIRLFEVASGRPRGQMMKGRGRIHSLEFSPDGRFLASVAQDLPSADVKNPTAAELARLREALREAGAILQIWDTTTGQPCGPPAKARVLHTALAFSSDGRHVLTLRPDSTGRLPVTAQLWRLPHGEVPFEEAQRRTWQAIGARLDAAGNSENIPDREWSRLQE